MYIFVLLARFTWKQKYENLQSNGSYSKMAANIILRNNISIWYWVFSWTKAFLLDIVSNRTEQFLNVESLGLIFFISNCMFLCKVKIKLIPKGIVGLDSFARSVHLWVHCDKNSVNVLNWCLYVVLFDVVSVYID